MLIVRNGDTLPRNLPPYVRQVLQRTTDLGHSVAFAASGTDLEPLICPNETGVHSATFLDTIGKRFGESVVTRAANVFGVSFPDPKLRKRPSHPRAIVIGDDLPSCQPRLLNAYGHQPKTVLDSAERWMAGNNLICAVGRCGPTSDRINPFLATPLPENWAYMRVLMVLPEQSAWLLAGLNLIHNIEPVRFEDGLPDVDGVILGAYGLRPTLFYGEQTAVHFREFGFPTLVISNASYPGHGMKKTMMGLAIEREARNGSFLHHAAVVRVEQLGGGHICVMVVAPSGGGKTELAQTFPDGEILIARWRNGTTVIPALEQCTPWAVCDDIFVMPSFMQLTRSGRGCGFSFEDGLFDRVDDANAPGVLPAEDHILATAQHDAVVVNFHVSPGETVHTHDHAIEGNGDRNTNPRIIAKNTRMPRWHPDPVTIDVFGYGLTCVPTTKEKPHGAIVGLWHELNAALMWAITFAGPRASASVSQDGNLGTGPMCTEPYGTCSPFATVPRRLLGLNLFKQLARWWNTDLVLVPVKWIGDRQVGFYPSRLMREAYARRKSGTSSWKLEVARAPFLGRHVLDLNIAENFFSIGLEDVARQGQLGTDGYDEAAAYLHGLCWSELEPLLADLLRWLGEDELSAGDRAWVALMRKVIEAFRDIKTGIDVYDRLTEDMHRMAGRFEE